VKISKQARRDAKELFLACRPKGVLDEVKVREVVKQVIALKPRGYIPILTHFQRLVKLDVERRTARIESPVPLAEPQQASDQGESYAPLR
jgi:F-type H+-transporting ATPase subunit delta